MLMVGFKFLTETNQRDRKKNMTDPEPDIVVLTRRIEPQISPKEKNE